MRIYLTSRSNWLHLEMTRHMPRYLHFNTLKICKCCDGDPENAVPMFDFSRVLTLENRALTNFLRHFFEALQRWSTPDVFENLKRPSCHQNGVQLSWRILRRPPYRRFVKLTFRTHVGSTGSIFDKAVLHVDLVSRIYPSSNTCKDTGNHIFDYASVVCSRILGSHSEPSEKQLSQRLFSNLQTQISHTPSSPWNCCPGPSYG